MEAKKEALREAIARGEQKTAGRRKQSTQSEETVTVTVYLPIASRV